MTPFLQCVFFSGHHAEQVSSDTEYEIKAIRPRILIVLVEAVVSPSSQDKGDLNGEEVHFETELHPGGAIVAFCSPLKPGPQVSEEISVDSLQVQHVDNVPVRIVDRERVVDARFHQGA